MYFTVPFSNIPFSQDSQIHEVQVQKSYFVPFEPIEWLENLHMARADLELVKCVPNSLNVSWSIFYSRIQFSSRIQQQLFCLQRQHCHPPKRDKRSEEWSKGRFCNTIASVVLVHTSVFKRLANADKRNSLNQLFKTITAAKVSPQPVVQTLTWCGCEEVFRKVMCLRRKNG